MKNTGVWFSAVLVCGLVGCAPAGGPKSATPVLLEEQVKVTVDKEGHSQVAAEAGAPASAEKAPE